MRPSSINRASVGTGDSMVRMGPLTNSVRFMAATSFFSIMPLLDAVIKVEFLPSPRVFGIMRQIDNL